MQSFARTSTLGTTYTDAQVRALLIDQQNQERWFFDLLDAGFNYKADLTAFVDYEKQTPKIVHDSTAVVRRNLAFSLRGDGPEHDILSDLIQARYQVMAPDGGWLEWVLGVFTIVPHDHDIYPGWTWNRFQIPDLSQLLVDSNFTSSFSAQPGQNYISVITSIVNSYGGFTPININIPPTSSVVPATIAWETGITRLQAINDLLAAINYFPAWMDETGTLRSAPIPDYLYVTPIYTFDTTNNSSIVLTPIQGRPDISKIYNQVVVNVEDARRVAFSVPYNNDNPNDPISRSNWHPKTLVVRDSKIVDKATALNRARYEAQLASRHFETAIMSTFPWPLSQDQDVYGVVVAPAELEPEIPNLDYFVETKWEHSCKAGMPTIHTFEKIVQL